MAVYGPKIGENGPGRREKASCGTEICENWPGRREKATCGPEIGKNGPVGQRRAGCSGGRVCPLQGMSRERGRRGAESGGGGAASEP